MTVRIETPEKIVRVETFVKGLIATGMSSNSIKNQVLDKFCDNIEEQAALMDLVEKILMTSCDLGHTFAMLVKPEDSINRYYSDGEHPYRRVHVGYVVNGKFWKLADVGNVTFAEELCDKQHRERNAPYSTKREKLNTFNFVFTSGREMTHAERNHLDGFNLKYLGKQSGDCPDHLYGVDLESVWDFARLVKQLGKPIIMDTSLRLEVIDGYRE